MNSLKFSYYIGCRERVMAGQYTELIDFLHRSGYSAIELLEFFGEEQIFTSIEEAAELKALLEKEKISVSCYSVCVDVYDNINAAESYLKGQIDIARALGSPYLHHTVRTPLDRRTAGVVDIGEVMPVVLPTLTHVADYARQRGITILYEPQGLCFNGGNLQRLIKALENNGAENIKICLDLGNPAFVDYDAHRYIEELGHLIRHVHIKDYRYSEGDGNYESFSGKRFFEVGYGMGDMQNARCLEMLQACGYDGYFSTELTPVGISSDDAGVDAIRQIRQAFSAK